MLGLHEGTIPLTEGVKKHLDLCLDCRACETACPSGVVYHELIEDFRARAPHTSDGPEESHDGKPQPAGSKLMRALFFQLLTKPTRLKFALLPARAMQKVGLYGLVRKTGVFKLLPAGLAKMENMLPAKGPLWPRRVPAKLGGGAGPVTLRVGFFEGCVGQVMFADVNRKAAELLAACRGVEVYATRAQTCCGAIHHHNGAHEPAIAMAKANIDAFCPKDASAGPGVDVIVNTIAGCGAMLREYDVLLRDDPEYAERAKQFVAKVRDVSEVLASVELPPLTHAIEKAVTYHDACHLAHAQKVTAPPRALLTKIPGLKLVALPESDMCCGAAGTYNLTQPEMATRLAERKLNHIGSTGATTCATGNVGCAMHIQSQADATGRPVKVVHPVELLHAAAFGER
jgi:glycolate oxidase iron-sulfur subunit